MKPAKATELTPSDHFSTLQPLKDIGPTELLDLWWKSRSPQTNRAYKADIEIFRKWLKESQGLPVDTADQAAEVLLSGGQGVANRLAQGFQNHLKDSGKAAASVSRTISALRSLVKQANLLGIVPWKLTVTRVEVESCEDTRGPGLDNYRKMLQATKMRKQAGDPRGIRDCAILVTLYSLGLRRSELVNTTMADLDLERGALAVLGKGKSQKTKLTLPQATKDALADWMKARGTEDGHLFCGIDRWGNFTGGLSGNGLYYLIKELGRQVGVETRVHRLRHTAVTQAVRAAGAANLDISTVLHFSRHKSLEVLQKYIDNDRDYQGQIANLGAVGMDG